MLQASAAVPAQREPDGSVAAAPPGGRHRSVEQPGGWWRSLRAAGLLWLAINAGWAAITILNASLAGAPVGAESLSAWLQWDAWHYRTIAMLGYEAVPEEAAFFPLYPLLFDVLDPALPGDLMVSAMVVSNVCGLGALVVLHRLLAVEFDESVAGRALFFLLAFPSAFFLAAPFTHALFLLLCTGFLYALRRRSWWLAGALGGLASATRPFGVLLVLPFVVEYLRVRFSLAGDGSFAGRLRIALGRVRVSAAAVALIPAGTGAFVLYCWIKLGDPLAYTHGQVSGWNKIVTWPGHTLWLAVEQLRARPPAENYSLLIDLAATLLAITAIVVCLVGRWRLRRDQWYLLAFAVPILLVPLCVPGLHDNPLQSMTRYVLDAAVLFAVPARIAISRNAERSYVLVALALQCGFLLMYLRGLWVF